MYLMRVLSHRLQSKPKRNSLFEANDAEQQNVEEASGGSQADTPQGSSITEVNSIKLSYFVGAGDKREHGLSKTKWKGMSVPHNL